MLVSDFTTCLPGVFFRTKQIKGTPLLQLVDAYRNTEGQPRQRVVASLGNASLPAGDPRHLAKAKHGKNKQKRNDCRQVAVAMISNAEQRFLKDSGRLQARVSKGRLKRETLIERAIGALLKKHPKVARFYQLTQSGDVRDWQTLRRFAGPWVAGAFHGIT